MNNIVLRVSAIDGMPIANRVQSKFPGYRITAHLTKHVKTTLRRCWLSAQQKVLILLYHSVEETDSDPHSLCVTPKHFREHLEHLKDNYHPISLLDLKTSLDRKRIPSRAVVITFDDGYANNLYEAKPLLEQYRIPATVFVITRAIENKREFWFRELEQMLICTPTIPENVRITLNGREHGWNMGKWVQLSPPDIFAYRTYRGKDTHDATTRHCALPDLRNLLRSLNIEEQEDIMAQLRSQIGIDGQPRSCCRPLTCDEVCRLAEGGLVEVGAHTVTHPTLRMQSLEMQRWEITESKKTLEAILEKPVTSFAYPYGERSDVGDAAIQLSREAGFDLACAVGGGPVTRWSDPFWLPRKNIKDCTADEFALRLSRWFSG